MELGNAAQLKQLLYESCESVINKPQFAVLAASFYNPDMLTAIVQASHNTKKPVIAHTQAYVYTQNGQIGLVEGVKAYQDQLRSCNLKAQIFLGIDHFKPDDLLDGLNDLQTVMSQTDVAIVSVDGSRRSPQKNIEFTRQISTIGEQYDVLVEGHYGRGISINIPEVIENLAEKIVDYIEKTGIDIINYNVGTRHGGRHSKFNPELLKDVQDYISKQIRIIPFGLHGGSGMTNKQIIRENLGHFNKFNIATNFAVTYGQILSKAGKELPISEFVIPSPNEELKKLKKHICTLESQDVNIDSLTNEIVEAIQLLAT
jgi:fructose/tagatose bisphosphate aldolase